MGDVVDISEVLRRVTEPFKPQDLVTANDANVRIARLRGVFPWHEHDEDELVSSTSSRAARGIRPVADRDAVTLLLERPETLQYGNT